jgi:hypothetical protein
MTWKKLLTTEIYNPEQGWQSDIPPGLEKNDENQKK